MKKRKISLIIIAIAMALCMVLFVILPACSSGDKDEGNTEQNQEQSGGDVDPGEGGDGSGSGNEGSSGSKDVNQEELPSTTIYMVGDSTMCGFTDPYYLPRYGYGTQMYNYFYDAADYSDAEGAKNDSKVTIRNLALSGRSSLSFLSESNYTTLQNSISAGDYLIIGFGHNDEKVDEDDKYTDPSIAFGTDKDGTATGFKDNLYNNYIALAESVGATPILCTPIVRYSDDETKYDGSKSHVTDQGDYPQAIIELGKATDTTVIDLTAITKADYLADNDAAQWYHSHTTVAAIEDDEVSTAPMARQIETANSHHADPENEDDEDALEYQWVVPDGRDDTHLNMYGAKMVAYEFAEALAETDNPLADYVLTNAEKPSIEKDMEAAYNPDYVYTPYEGFDPENDNTSVTGLPEGWYGTHIGFSSGYTISYNSSTATADKLGTFTVGTTGTNGKIESTASDQFPAAFMQLDRYTNFEISATATITADANHGNSQTAFGIMLRDDIYIDNTTVKTTSNYVTAGAIGSSGDSSYANYARVDGSLKKETALTPAFNKDSVYELKMVRTNETVHCYITPQGGSEIETVRTDISYYGVDTDYIYLCLFATRGVMCEFSNVVYTSTGVNEGA